jgi:hypothetical protein
VIKHVVSMLSVPLSLQPDFHEAAALDDDVPKGSHMSIPTDTDMGKVSRGI